MKKYRVNYKDRNYVVSADNHISAVNKVRKVYKDAKIKDFDEKPYLNELSKLAVEGQRLSDLKRTIIKAAEKIPQIAERGYSDPRISQWVKQARRLKDKWNRVAKILVDKFNLGSTYLYDTNVPDANLWNGFESSLPDESAVRRLKYAIMDTRERKGQHDAAIKDSKASDIVKEIKKAYPSVHIKTISKSSGNTYLTFSNYPNKSYSETSNWEKFLNYLGKKYIGSDTNYDASASSMWFWENKM